jgi:hypothetical protein
MITCHRSHLESRCFERGYTLEEVLPCVVLRDGDTWTVDVEHNAYPRLSRIAEQLRPAVVIEKGPGTELKKLLARIGITSTPNCSCNRVAREMDAWGPDECGKPERMAEILAAMRENAEKRKLPWIETLARMLIRRAISNARRASA